MRIRTFQPEDAVALSALFYRSVTHLGRRAYSAAQVAAWAARTPTPGRMHQLGRDGRLVLVAVVGQRIVAYGDLEQRGHIDHLYAAPEVAGKGLTSHLYDCLEKAAREQGIDQLFTEASELAKPFFTRKGFTLQKRRDFEIMGVAIHNYSMIKQL